MSKITPEARKRCDDHTLQEQLMKVRAIHAVEVARLRINQAHDMREVEQALEADRFWGGHHTRLVMPIEGSE